MKKDKTKNNLQFNQDTALRQNSKASASGQFGSKQKQGTGKKKYYDNAKSENGNAEQKQGQDFSINEQQPENKVLQPVTETEERSEASTASQHIREQPPKKHHISKRRRYYSEKQQPLNRTEEKQSTPTDTAEQPKSSLQHDDKTPVSDTSGVGDTSGQHDPKLKHDVAKNDIVQDTPKTHKQSKNEAHLQSGGADLKTAPPPKGKKQRYYKNKMQDLKDDKKATVKQERKSRLHFEDDTAEPSNKNIDTSGQADPKPKTSSKFHVDSEKPRPSERLTHEGETSLTGTKAEKRLEKSKLKADKSGVKLEKAKDKLSKQKPPKKPGLTKSTLRATKHEAWRFAHGKFYEVEHENVGIEAAHRTELVGEKAVGGTVRFVKKQIRTHPTRKVRKLSKRNMKANADYSYKKFAQENPQKHSNPISRYWQKKQYKRKHIKESKKAAKTTAKAAKKTATATKKATAAIVNFVKSNPKVVLILLCAFLLIVIIQALVSSVSMFGNGILGSVGGTSYLSSDADIDSVELHYTEWETDLQLSISDTPNARPGYDEYRYNIADISHNPYELLAFLTAVYDDFTYAEVENVLQEIFNEQYVLTYTEQTETRYRTAEDGSEEAYQWRTLTTTLTAQSFSNVVFYRMNAEQLERFNVYMILKGNRQYLKSPFDFNWLPNVTSYYGYRVHPITGVKDYHAGADIGVPTGTEIHAGHDGTVTFAGSNGNYGLVVVLEDGDGLVSKYAHCNTLTVSVGQTVSAGDVIATVGSTGNSTGPHLHLEIIKDGQYLNPLYFAETNDFGEGPTYSGNPGAAMGDGSYAALIAEAELHLGKPYVFGANGPNSFDCSSYVCWVLTKSGVYNMPRTTAYGIYQQCTPIPQSEAKPGDIIFFHSTYSTTSPISHVGIYVGNGMMIHAGSPIQYTSINSTYWQNHFYGFARVPN